MNADDDSFASESIDLPDDLLILLAKDYIRERDGLSLSLTGNDERFASFYGSNRRSLVISKYYFLASLSPESAWDRFFNRHIDPTLIHHFDASQCYWLSAEDLCHYIHQFSNLEELNIQDTQIRFGHLPQIFKACQKITKLAFTLAEKNLDDYVEGCTEKDTMDWMTQGFDRITHLKIFMFALGGTYDESWLVILGVLKWCRSCVDLFIKVANIERDGRDPYRPGFGDPQLRRIFKIAYDLLISHIVRWLRNLKSLVVVSQLFNKYHSPSQLERFVLNGILEWLAEQNHHLEHLWLTDDGIIGRYSEQVMTISLSLMKSLVLDQYEEEDVPVLPNFPLNEPERLGQLQHLSGLRFSRLDYLPKLKFFRGECHCDYKDLNEFCQNHPMLEQLHFDTIGVWPNDDYVEDFGNGDWKLPLLKVLVYRFWDTTFQAGMMGYMVKSCQNIEELDVKNDNSNKPRERVETIEFYMSIRFRNLTKLSICELDLFDGCFLPMITNQCPKLERIHLEGKFIESLFFSNLAECLSSASNLRDLRLMWNKNGPMDMSDLQRFGQSLLKCSSHLERLVLINKADERRGTDPHQMILHPHFLVPFVTKMTRLVTLCLVGFNCDPGEVEQLKQRFDEEILPNRPPFWFFVGPQLPEGNDKSVPRVHYDEIVCPIDAFRAPPRFFSGSNPDSFSQNS